jgi:predicted TIM-barrel fold metal-dependent hydrolase
VWQALNEKGAVVIVHPTHAVDTTLVAGAVPQPTVDYPHETTRVAVSLIAADTLNLHAPNCKVILSHAGGMLPYLANRVAVLPEVTDLLDKTRDAILAAIASFYYNVPLSSDEETIRLLLQYTTPDHLQYGTDYPYTPAKVVTRFADEVREGIHGENALSLFPRLRKE